MMLPRFSTLCYHSLWTRAAYSVLLSLLFHSSLLTLSYARFFMLVMWPLVARSQKKKKKVLNKTKKENRLNLEHASSCIWIYVYIRANFYFFCLHWFCSFPKTNVQTNWFTRNKCYFREASTILQAFEIKTTHYLIWNKILHYIFWLETKQVVSSSLCFAIFSLNCVVSWQFYTRSISS